MTYEKALDRVNDLLRYAASLDADDLSYLVTTWIAAAIFGMLFGGVVGSLAAAPAEYETQYKVTISDEVSMNDFLEKYGIVDQEGKIYTVVERGVEE